MALISCPECSKQISAEAHACPYCGLLIAPWRVVKPAEISILDTPPQKHPHTMPTWAQVVVGLIGAYMMYSCMSGLGSDKGTKASTAASSGFGWNDALLMCQTALKRAARDPEKADIPYVPNNGTGDEYYYAWGASTKMARMRNGLGLEVAASASCTVSHSQKRITSLTLDGKSIL